MSKGTAPSMTPDLQQIIDEVRAQLPDVRWEQQQVTYPADDDGLWFFSRPGMAYNEVQIESSWGTCPFRIETIGDNVQRLGGTPAEVASIVVVLLS